jgi:ThiF family
LVVLLPKTVADGIAASGVGWGWLTLKWDRAESLIVVSGWSKREQRHYPDPGEWSSTHFTRHHKPTMFSGVWYRGTTDLHDMGIYAVTRASSVKVEAMRAEVKGWRHPPRGNWLVLTVAERNGEDEWIAWSVSRDEAKVLKHDLFDPDAELLAPLDRAWPRPHLRDCLVTVIGLGSIGSAAVEALASYGVGRLALVDPDHLEAHNFARHRAHRRDQGRLKVRAVADMLKARDPKIDVEVFPVDVGTEADVMRPLFQRSRLILCCADGTRPRRVTNHLAYWAGKPLVMAAVAEFGAYGEVLRLLPGRTGCYLCNRAALEDVLGLDIDAAGNYEDTEPHAPMTAVTGDLGLVGQLAAKAAVATLLSRRGQGDQKLAGDQAIVGLRPVPPFPEPFETQHTGTIRWDATAPPRDDCPVCGTAT